MSAMKVCLIWMTPTEWVPGPAEAAVAARPAKAARTASFLKSFMVIASQRSGADGRRLRGRLPRSRTSVPGAVAHHHGLDAAAHDRVDPDLGDASRVGLHADVATDGREGVDAARAVGRRGAPQVAPRRGAADTHLGAVARRQIELGGGLGLAPQVARARGVQGAGVEVDGVGLRDIHRARAVDVWDRWWW